MNDIVNPYIYFSDRYLIRKIKKYEKVLGRIVRGKSSNLDFNANRAVLLTYSEALNIKKTNEFFNSKMVEFIPRDLETQTES